MDLLYIVRMTMATLNMSIHFPSFKGVLFPIFASLYQISNKFNLKEKAKKKKNLLLTDAIHYFNMHKLIYIYCIA